MNLFDTHAHLDSDQLAEQTPEILADAKTNSVSRILTVSTTLASCYRSLKLAEQHSMVYAAVGIHPCSCHQANPAQWKEITTLIDRPKVVAIGETGLDGYWDDCPMETHWNTSCVTSNCHTPAGYRLSFTCEIARPG